MYSRASQQDCKSISVLLCRNAPHQMLNARPQYVRKEAKVIAQAGLPRMITIATNMAGRGVDILMGGEPQGLAQMALEQLVFKPHLSGEALLIISHELRVCALQSSTCASEGLRDTSEEITEPIRTPSLSYSWVLQKETLLVSIPDRDVHHFLKSSVYLQMKTGLWDMRTCQVFLRSLPAGHTCSHACRPSFLAQ